MENDLLDELHEILLKKQENFNNCIILVDKLQKGYEEEKELNTFLCKRIVELETRIVELESRPPIEGGSIYQLAKEHFTKSEQILY